MENNTDEFYKLMNNIKNYLGEANPSNGKYKIFLYEGGDILDDGEEEKDKFLSKLDSIEDNYEQRDYLSTLEEIRQMKLMFNGHSCCEYLPSNVVDIIREELTKARKFIKKYKISKKKK